MQGQAVDQLLAACESWLRHTCPVLCVTSTHFRLYQLPKCSVQEQLLQVLRWLVLSCAGMGSRASTL